MGYLVFWVTLNDVKPINIQIEAMKNMMSLTCQKEVRRFIGLVNDYQYMWAIF